MPKQRYRLGIEPFKVSLQLCTETSTHIFGATSNLLMVLAMSLSGLTAITNILS